MPDTISGVDLDGDEIKRLREAKRMTQVELATAIGVGPRTISNWETGATVPKNRMGMLRSFFGVDLNGEDPLRTASDVALAAEILRRAVDQAARAG